ncbi:MAG: patatin-like phospholipase family protein [Acidimicrobiia bacterium]
MTTAFVLSGGASHGAVQVGMLQALAERRVRPDLVFGASAGALNAAWVAGDPNLEHLGGLAHIWTSLRARDVFPLRPITGLLGFLGRRDALVSPTSLRAVIARNLRFEQIEDAKIPLCVVATEVTSGREVALTRGNAIDAIIASATIPGVLPPVKVDGKTLMDGGVVNNTPISNAIDAGATLIYVLPTGYACDLQHVPHSAIGMTLQAISLLVQQRLITDVHELQDHVDLRVLPPLCPLNISPADFSHARELIDRARGSAGRWLDSVDLSADRGSDLDFHEH